jgi:hypothetical protein
MLRSEKLLKLIYPSLHPSIHQFTGTRNEKTKKGKKRKRHLGMALKTTLFMSSMLIWSLASTEARNDIVSLH